MVEIKKGDVIAAENVRIGESSKGKYFMCKVSATKGKGFITVWNNDGFECADGDTIRIADIISVKRSNRQYQDKWYDETSITATLEFVSEAPKYTDLMPVDVDETTFGGELPY